MGAAAYNRGTRVVAREADAAMPAATERGDRRALTDQVESLRGHVARLERDIARARRCIAAERYARTARVAELRAELRAADAAITILCRRAFPHEQE